MLQFEPFTGSVPTPTLPKLMQLALPSEIVGSGAERPLVFDAGGLLVLGASTPSSAYDVAPEPGSASRLKSVLAEF